MAVETKGDGLGPKFLVRNPMEREIPMYMVGQGRGVVQAQPLPARVGAVTSHIVSLGQMSI